MGGSGDALWETLFERLRGRRSELEQALLMRVQEISDGGQAGDPEYVLGIRSTVQAAIDYSLAAIEKGEEIGPVPVALLSQARLAARSGVRLETVLRRYFAGYTLLGEYIVAEAEAENLLHRDALKRLMRAQAILLDRVLAAVGEEHARELRELSSTRRLRVERVKRLLDGDPQAAVDLGYEVDCNHVALVAVGEDARETIYRLGAQFDCLSLVVPGDEPGMIWAWLGSRRQLDSDPIARRLSVISAGKLTVAFGEACDGLSGWRLTHRQARAAIGIALFGRAKIVRYADVAVLAAALRDQVLVSSLRTLYLTPLAQERDGGEVALKTLRAYFAADRNVSSAAAALGVSRQTVGTRLRVIEERIGRPLSECGSQLEIALQLDGEEQNRDLVGSGETKYSPLSH